MDLIKKKASVLLAIAILFVVVIYGYRISVSWKEVRENCTGDVIGQPLLRFKKNLMAENNIRMSCYTKGENVCFFSGVFMGPSCKITYSSSDETILSYEYFPADGETH